MGVDTSYTVMTILRIQESGTYVCHAGASKKVVEVVVQCKSFLQQNSILFNEVSKTHSIFRFCLFSDRPEVRIEQIHLTSEQGRKEFWIR